jgi:hypothetical protein
MGTRLLGHAQAVGRRRDFRLRIHPDPLVDQEMMIDLCVRWFLWLWFLPYRMLT